jgi:cytidine deaminase
LEKREITTRYIVYESVDELPDLEKKLLIAAKAVVQNAYAPYSEFQVGSAVLLENGNIVTGTNQENAAYPSGLCAERVAIFSASSQNPGIAIKALALSAHSSKSLVNNPVTPCGACRQVLAEYENLYKSPVKLIMSGETGKIFVFENVESLLPFSFKAEELK